MMRTAWRCSAAFGLLLCLQAGVQGKDKTPSPTKEMNTQLFSAAVERDPKTGWSIAVLKYTDPGNAKRSLEARIAAEAGSNLYSLKIGGTEVLVQPAEWGTTPSLRYGFPVLFPTPNRVRDSKFTFDSQTYTFPANERTHFIHGLVHKLPWKAGAASADAKSASMETYLDWDSNQPDFKLFPIKNRVAGVHTYGGVHAAREAILLHGEPDLLDGRSQPVCQRSGEGSAFVNRRQG